jgi:uncharacterized protein YcbK (DUF882 family)
LAGFKVSNCVGRGGAAAQLAVAAVFAAAWLVPSSTESAVANGDTRTITLSNQHTSESGSFTFMVNGVYDSGTLDKLNYFCRDWRLNEPTKMDPHLFDIIWEVYRESGSTQPIDVLSAYRSPQTNAMLRRRSRQVAEHSQHMQGRAIDAHFVDVGTGRIRDVAMRMQAGGVGFYPTGNTPWVHIDSGSVRYWPRMSRDALTRLFPDGKTVFIPADGQPMARYEEARAEIEARGGQIQMASGGGIGGLFSWLFGGGADDAEESGGQEATTTMATSGNARGGRSGGPQPQVEVADVGPQAVAKAKRNLPSGPAYASAPEPAPALKQQAPEPQAEVADVGPQAVAKAKRNLPSGPTYASAADSAPTPPVKPQTVAALEQPNVASDASTDEPRSAPIARFLAPLPPRRPADLVALALAGSPMPPTRPADLILASKTDPGGSAFTPPSNKPFNATPAAGQVGSLPQIITSGVDRTPTGALALLEAPSAPRYDDSALLARAAELTAPLPPMPIPAAVAAAPAPAPDKLAAAAPARTGGAEAAAPQEHGWVLRTAALAAEDLAQLFGSLGFRTAPSAVDMREPQQ